jgi:hypothetical protein
MRRTTSASRAYGRSAVNLRPTLDPDALPARPKDGEQRQKKDPQQQNRDLTGRLRSFRNDTGRIGWSAFEVSGLRSIPGIDPRQV